MKRSRSHFKTSARLVWQAGDAGRGAPFLPAGWLEKRASGNKQPPADAKNGAVRRQDPPSKQALTAGFEISSRRDKFYITTAIDYVNNLPHIGTAFEKIGADVLARFKKLDGLDVRFQIGSDEHSTNVKRAAGSEPPKAYCDRMRKEFEAVWGRLSISYDDFIQTTEERHIKGVKEMFQKIYDRGDIYKAKYEGWYCESCEAYYLEKDLVEGVCPTHKIKPVWLAEDNYFFKLSSYTERLIKHIEANPEFVLPPARRNEVMSLLRQGLNDISFSRATCDWGIPVPFDPSHVVWVWFDALANYLTGIGYGAHEGYKKWWPADVHIIGKDIIRFHCVIWPAMLLSAGLPLPKCVFAHGFVTSGGAKMSKTVGNVVAPMDVVERHGADALRYYLLRNTPFGNDVDFTWGHFIERYNSDLANGIGNLVSRTVGMVERYLSGSVKSKIKNQKSKIDKELEETVVGTLSRVREALDYTHGELEFNTALASIWDAISATDRYINENAPWELAKNGSAASPLPLGERVRVRGRLETVLYNVVEAIRVITILISPFMPETARKIWRQMGFEALGNCDDISFKDVKWGVIKQTTIHKMGSLFPRIETKTEAGGKKHEAREEKKMQINDQIDIAEFARLDLRVAEIKSAERVEGADKLLKLQIDIGSERRQIVAGIAKAYNPEGLIGKKIAVVTNLKPVTIRGVVSQGMLLAASSGEALTLLTVDRDIPTGARIK